ncbi:MAG: aminotransferase class I/II-fold pyridoxal phosphate-dependent enzyme [Anaerolineae bacterium]
MPAQRLKGLTESLIREMTRLAIAHNAINLSQGFPDFATPAELKQAAADAIMSDHNQYAITWGQPAMRQAIADKLNAWYDMGVDAEKHVTVCVGVTESILATMMSIVDPGDEVIIIEPFHETFLPATLFAGGVPVYFPLHAPDFRLDADRLRQVFTPRTRAIILNTPHNPTGRVFTREELQGVADLCQEFDVIAVTDEIYEHIIYDGRQHIPLATFPGMKERTVTCGGLSKTYAITGWRLAYTIADVEISNAIRTVHDFTTICAPTPLQEAAVTALRFPRSYYDQLQADYHARRARMMAMLDDTGFQALTPEGAYYVMADFGGLGFPTDDDLVFARWLTTEVGVAVVPGSSFYRTPDMGRGMVRFAFPKKLETLDAAHARLTAGLAKLKAGDARIALPGAD